VFRTENRIHQLPCSLLADTANRSYRV
jgi:hypothetical protein